MSRHASLFPPTHRTARSVLALVLSAWFLLAAIPARAADKFGTSLDEVPADAAFYGSSLRMKEQIEIAAHSKAWQAFKALPAVQMLWQHAQQQLNDPDNPATIAAQVMQLPENQELLKLAGDMFSQEVFVYGDKSFTDFLSLVSRIQNTTNIETAIAGIKQANGVFQDPGEAQQRTLFNILDANRDKITAPGLVMGFKITDRNRAQTQLKRLEIMAGLALQQVPQLKGRLKRVKVGDDEMLAFTVDGSLVPWEEVPFDKAAQQPGQYDKLKDKLKSLTLTVTLGVKGDYLLVAIGSSSDIVNSLGRGEALGSRPELKPALEYAKKRLTGVNYVSKAFNSATRLGKEDIDNLVQGGDRLVAEAGLDPTLAKRVKQDIAELSKDLKQFVPEAGAAVEFDFLTESGSEGYAYDWSQNLGLDGSARLTLLDHLGGSPLAAIVARSKYSPEQYQLLVKWLKAGYGYFQDLAVPQMNAEERQNYQQVAELAKPFLERLNKATGEMLIPSLKDGQVALVLDAKAMSKQWIRDMPPSDQPLPMLEPALVLGVSDSELLKKAIGEYTAIANDILAKVKELNPGALPPGFEIPAPQVTTLNSGKSYWYALPPEPGIDSQIVLNAGFGDKVAVFGITVSQAERVLASNPLADRLIKSDGQQPLAAAAYFNWAATVDAISPWVDYGIRSAGGDVASAAAAAGGPANREEGTKWVLDQVHTVFDILKCFRSVSATTTVKDGVTITHIVSEVRDLP